MRFIGPSKKVPTEPRWEGDTVVERPMAVAVTGGFAFERLDITKGELSVAQVDVGAFHCVASTLEGQVITWGKNVLHSRDAGAVSEQDAVVAGQLGCGAVLASLPVRLADLPAGEVIVDVNAGLNHTVVAGRDAVYSCGSNAFAQLGRDGDTLTLCKIPLLSTPVSSVACGDQHTVVVTEEGAVFAWGR